MPPRRESRPFFRARRKGQSDRQGRGRKATAAPRRPPSPPPLVPVPLAAGLIVIGALLGGSLLNVVWPKPDRAAPESLELTPAGLAEKPRRPVTVLVIGLDSDRLKDPVNKAAPRGPAAADALLLVRVNPKGPLQVLNLPVELAISLPGQSRPVALGSLYRLGGVRLTADAVREVVGLEPPRPDRYLVLPRSALRRIVEVAGGLELSPRRVMRYEDKAQKYRIDLQSGLQRLDGRQVEQLVRFRDPELGDSGRRLDHEMVQSGIRDRLGRSEVLVRLPDLLRDLQPEVETNLSARETLSLLAAGLDDQRPIQFTRLPLMPTIKEFAPLRQLERPRDKPAGTQLWPAS